mgnify:CR=1 FL=1
MLTQAEFDALARQGFNRIPVILSLFADLGKHEIFTPVTTHPPTTVRELAALQEK